MALAKSQRRLAHTRIESRCALLSASRLKFRLIGQARAASASPLCVVDGESGKSHWITERSNGNRCDAYYVLYLRVASQPAIGSWPCLGCDAPPVGPPPSFKILYSHRL